MSDTFARSWKVLKICKFKRKLSDVKKEWSQNKVLEKFWNIVAAKEYEPYHIQIGRWYWRSESSRSHATSSLNSSSSSSASPEKWFPLTNTTMAQRIRTVSRIIFIFCFLTPRKARHWGFLLFCAFFGEASEMKPLCYRTREECEQICIVCSACFAGVLVNCCL